MSASNEAGASMRDFADLRRHLMSLACAPITDLGRGVWIHGAGGFGRSVARALTDAGICVIGFIDRKGDGVVSIDGLTVHHPDEVAAMPLAGTYHVHGLMNHYVSSLEVTEWAVGRGFAGCIFPADLYRIPGFALRNYWLTRPADTLAELDDLETVHDALADDESRVLLRDLLVYRLTCDPRLHPVVRTADAYKPDFMPIRDQPITFIDGGAYNGDTLEAFLDDGIPVADWIAIEPDARNMAAAAVVARRHAHRLTSYTLLRLGLSDHEGRVAFAEGGGEASHMLDQPGAAGVTSIDIARLDDLVHRKGNVYIKLDIEGAEMAALRGMPHLLADNPLLALSIYHKPADLWEIPLYLMRSGVRGRFRIRQHGYHGFDTVLYVSPR